MINNNLFYYFFAVSHSTLSKKFVCSFFASVCVESQFSQFECVIVLL